MRWVLLLLLSILPIQWVVVGSGLRLHVAAIFIFAAIVAFSHRASSHLPVIRVALPFVIANAALVLFWLGANFYNGLSLRQPVQQMVFLAAFIALGTVCYRGANRADGRFLDLLRWASLATSVTLVSALSYSMYVNGISAIEVFAKTIATADPEILQKELFRSAFTGFGFDEDVVRGNIRHEVFGSVLVSMGISAICVNLRPWKHSGQRALYRFSLGLGIFLIVVSLSRSIMIAAVVWPMLALLRHALEGHFSPRTIGIALGGLAIGVVLWFVGVIDILWVRFTQDTGSYEARDGLLELALQNIAKSTLTGGVATSSASSHNFVLDTWLRSGVFGALAALVVTVLILGLFLTLAFTLHREPPWMLPVTAMLALPLVRLFTAGGGLIPPVSWVALGIIAGFMAYRAQLRAATTSSRHPAPYQVSTQRTP